jgi:preprotein translocase subunit SecA
MEGLVAAIHAMGLDGPGTSEDELWELGGSEAITAHLHDLAEARIEAREQEVGDADWALVERLVLVRTIDSLWVEHLTELDDMRRGIGLRGYAQQDPLNEFRREAFRLYEELSGLIRHQVATTIFRVTVTRQPAAQSLPVAGSAAATQSGAGARRANAARVATGAGAGSSIATGLPGAPAVRGVRESLGDRAVEPAPGAGVAGSPRPGFTPAGARIGRNDPCFCGSGLKYKKCHGR